MLKFYNENYSNVEEIVQYLGKYQNHVIPDYHHILLILDAHLNEENIPKIESNNPFELIHQQMSDISCNIENCKIIYEIIDSVKQ